MARKRTRKRRRNTDRKSSAARSKVTSSSARTKSSSKNPWSWDRFSLFSAGKGAEHDYDILRDGKKVIATAKIDKLNNVSISRASRIPRKTIQKFESACREWGLHFAPRYKEEMARYDDGHMSRLWVLGQLASDPCRFLSLKFKPKPAPVTKTKSTPAKVEKKPEPEKDKNGEPFWEPEPEPEPEPQEPEPKTVKRSELIGSNIGPLFVSLRQAFAMTSSLAELGVLNYRRNKKDMTLAMMTLAEWAKMGLLDVDNLQGFITSARFPYCLWTINMRTDTMISLSIAPPTSESAMQEGRPFSKAIKITFVRQPPMGEVQIAD